MDRRISGASLEMSIEDEVMVEAALSSSETMKKGKERDKVRSEGSNRDVESRHSQKIDSRVEDRTLV